MIPALAQPAPSSDTADADAALRRVGVDPGAVRAALALFPVARVDVFGSVLTEGFGEHSDIDLLVEFRPDFRRTWGDMLRIEDAVEAVARRKIHATSRRGVEQSANPVRRELILGSARPLHVAP